MPKNDKRYGPGHPLKTGAQRLHALPEHVQQAAYEFWGDELPPIRGRIIGEREHRAAKKHAVGGFPDKKGGAWELIIFSDFDWGAYNKRPAKAPAGAARKARKNSTVAKFGACCACRNPFVVGEQISRTNSGWAHPNCFRNNPSYASIPRQWADSAYPAYGPPPRLASGSAYPEYSYDQFWRDDHAHGEEPIEVEVANSNPRRRGRRNPASQAVEFAIRGTGNAELARDAKWFDAKVKQAKRAQDAWGVAWWGDRLKVVKDEIKKRQKAGTWKIRKPATPVKKARKTAAKKARKNDSGRYLSHAIYRQMPDNAGPYTPGMFPYGMRGWPALYEEDVPEAKKNPRRRRKARSRRK